MPHCRIYLFTYKRPHLLPRAIESLIAQTFKNWVCEVHNDCPEDSFPQQYIEALNDPRFIIKNNEQTLGGTAGFNLAFAGAGEDYVSILEDDNWWELGFLQEMITLMDGNPGVNIAWSNMHIWKETAHNVWADTKTTIWPIGDEPIFFTWPDKRQAMGALHSNGAMMYRGNRAKKYLIPDNCDFSVIEPIRERTFDYPIVLVSKPLANFAQTLKTARSDDPLNWTFSQVMLLSSYIEASANKGQAFKELLTVYNHRKPSYAINFFLAATYLLKDPHLLKHFSLYDWFCISKWLLKYGTKLSGLKKHIKSQQNVYDFLLANTIVQNKKAGV